MVVVYSSLHLSNLPNEYEQRFPISFAEALRNTPEGFLWVMEPVHNLRVDDLATTDIDVYLLKGGKRSYYITPRGVVNLQRGDLSQWQFRRWDGPPPLEEGFGFWTYFGVLAFILLVAYTLVRGKLS